MSDQILSKAYATSTNVIKTILTVVVFQLILKKSRMLHHHMVLRELEQFFGTDDPSQGIIYS